MIVADFDPDFDDETPSSGAPRVLTLEEIIASRASVEKEDAEEPAPRPRPQPKAKGPLTAKSLVEQAKERLVELKAELEAASKLQAEHDALERLVAAADSLNT